MDAKRGGEKTRERESESESKRERKGEREMPLYPLPCFDPPASPSVEVHQYSLEAQRRDAKTRPGRRRARGEVNLKSDLPTHFHTKGLPPLFLDSFN